MKATFKGQVYQIDRKQDWTKLHLDVKGKVDTRLVTAQEAELDALVMIKTLVADNMKVGSSITITISDEEEDDKLI